MQKYEKLEKIGEGKSIYIKYNLLSVVNLGCQVRSSFSGKSRPGICDSLLQVHMEQSLRQKTKTPWKS